MWILQHDFSTFREEKYLRNRYEMCYVFLIFNNPRRVKPWLNTSRVGNSTIYICTHRHLRLTHEMRKQLHFAIFYYYVYIYIIYVRKMKNQHICNKILSHPYVQRHLCIHRYYINIYIYIYIFICTWSLRT